MACVVLGTDEFLPLARAQITARGLPGLPVVTVPHPIGGIPPAAVSAKAEPIVAVTPRFASSGAAAISTRTRPTMAARTRWPAPAKK